MDAFEDSERVGLTWLRPMLPGIIGEVLKPNGRLRVALLDPRCGDTYADRISYARAVAGSSGVLILTPCPLLKLVRLDETGEGEAEDVADCNRCGWTGCGGDLMPSVGGNLIASGSVSSDPIYTVRARGGGATK